MGKESKKKIEQRVKGQVVKRAEMELIRNVKDKYIYEKHLEKSQAAKAALIVCEKC